MPTRDERRAEAAKHLALMKGAFAKETQATIDAAIIYEDGDTLALELPEPTAEATETQVTSDFTTTALRHAQGKTAIVDPVSYTRPGRRLRRRLLRPRTNLVLGKQPLPRSVRHEIGLPRPEPQLHVRHAAHEPRDVLAERRFHS